VADLRPGRPSGERAPDTPADPARTGPATGHPDGDGAVPAGGPGLRPTPAEEGADLDQEVQPRILSWRRLLVCLAGGLVVAVAVVLSGLPELSVLAGWSVTAAGVLLWVWRGCWPLDHVGTKRLAEQEGTTRTTDTVVLVGAVASLVAVVEALVRSSAQDAVAVFSVVLGVLVVILSWALVNTVFALKYARLYYEGGDGGVDFHQDQPPTYGDFAYLAFTVGMSFAVSETDPTSTRVRTVALGHALMSYLFGTILIAVAVNLVTNLGQS
jgi:uncharacterized membrane protein